MILVTGANGLIGSSICKELLQSKIPFRALHRSHSDLSLLENEGVEWVEGDIIDPIVLHDLLVDIKTVIHCAAIVSYQKEDEKLMYEVNVRGTKTLVNMCLEMGVEHFIHLSSIAALGKREDDYKITEKNNWVESPNNSVYARTKYLAEVEVWRAHHEGLSACVVNPSVVLAPGDGLRSSSKLLKYVWDENRFFIDGKLNYVDPRDVAHVIKQIHLQKINGERFILNAGNITYQEIFGRIANRFDKKPPSFKVSSSLLKYIYILDQVKYFITRIKPVVTKEMLKSAKTNFIYVNDKSKEFFQLQYRTLDDTLDWACSMFKEKIKR